MEIKMLEKKDESRWAKFIENNESSTFFHQIGWKNVIEKTFGHKSVYLFAEENGDILGVLPLFLVDGLILGKRLVSVPYGPYCGCCVRDPQLINPLVSRAIELSKDLNVKYLELRNLENIPGIPTNNNYVTMLLDLTSGEESIWSNIRKGMKACVKKAAKEKFDVNLDSKNLNEFYLLYSKRMRELGTPVPPISFFNNIQKYFSDAAVATINLQGEVLASQFLLFFKKTVIYGWGASSKHYSEAHPTHLLLWEVIQDSINNGYKIFDFGRSAQDSGTYDFKKWWGAEPRNLYYQYHLHREQEIPYIHPSNPKYKIAIKIWRNLPLQVTNRVGPLVSKELI